MTTPERKMVTVLTPAMIMPSLDPDYLATLKAAFDQAAADGPLAPGAEAVQVMSSPVSQDLIIFTYTDQRVHPRDGDLIQAKLQIMFFEPPQQRLQHEVIIEGDRISVQSAAAGGPYRKEFRRHYRTKYVVARHRRDSNPESEYQLTFSNWPAHPRHLKSGFIPRSGHLLSWELVGHLKFTAATAAKNADQTTLHQFEILGLLFKKGLQVEMLSDQMLEHIAARFQDLSVLWSNRPLDIQTVLRALAVLDGALSPDGPPVLRDRLHELLVAEESEGGAPWPSAAVSLPQ